MITFFRTLLLLVLIGLPMQLLAATYDSASNAYERRDFNTAIQQFTELSNKNDPYAQYMLGRMYTIGEGTPRDYVLAYKWLHLSEKMGISDAGKLKNKVREKMSRRQMDRAIQLIEERQSSSYNSSQQAENLDPPVVRRVQQELANRGYFRDRVDGSIGKKTRKAIRRFQKDERLVVDGRISTELLESLHLSRNWGSTSNNSTNIDRADDTEEIGVFKKKLRKLIRKAKKRQAAEPWLIEKLEELAGIGRNLWSNVVLHENFLAENYQKGPGWQVSKGNFSYERGRGLIGSPDNTWNSSTNNMDDLASILLNTVLKQNKRVQGDRRLAKIENDTGFSNAFAIKVKTGELTNTRGFMLACSLGGPPSVGYRLVFQPGQWDQVKLFVVGKKNRKEIKSHSGQLNLDSAGSHTFEWTRSPDGKMVVLLDGQKLFQVKDTIITEPWQRMSIAHMGDQVILEEIELLDAGGQTTML